MLDTTYTESDETEKALRLCISLYLKATTACYINYMEGMIAVLELWGPTEEEISSLPQYPVYSYPDVCTCGHRFNLTGSTIRDHCFHCKGNVSTYQYAMYRITSLVGVPRFYIESVFAKVIYYGY